MGDISYQTLKRILKEENILKGEPMSRHTTFRIGGPADYFLMPESAQETAELIRLMEESKYPYYIIGNGSNLLVSDQGFRGAVIQLFRNFSEIDVEGNVITAQAGASLAKIAQTACEEGLAGFAFAGGIPGTLGGACVMNAGAYGGEMKDVLVDVTVTDRTGRIFTIENKDLALGYRTSIIAEKGYIVLSARIRLEPGDKEEIRAVMSDLRERRISKQPLEYPSAGSTFKRPEGYFAGKLIQDAGLRGFRVGDAMVSEKHCGFVINVGEATAEQVDTLMKEVARRVKEQFGVTLEPEVKRLGEF